MAANEENDDKANEKGVTIRTSVRGTLPMSTLKAFVFIVQSLCPEGIQPIDIREYDRVFSAAPDVKVPKNSIRVRSRVQLQRPSASSGSQSQSHPQNPSQVHVQTQHPGVSTANTSTATTGVATTPATSRSNTNISSYCLLPGPVVVTFTNIRDRRVVAPYERRAVTTVVASSAREAEALLGFLGCTFEYEYIRKGVRHLTRGGLTVDIFGVERLLKPGDVTATAPMTPDGPTFVFEVWSDNISSTEPLITFVQLLSPFISLSSSS